MQDKLQKTVEEFRIYSERANILFNETVQCLDEMESQAKLSKDVITDMFSSISMQDIERALNKRPAVVFIGNRNCGKSAILNELLGGSYLPVHETPCTSRIVKIGYTPNQNTVRVVDKMGQETLPLTEFNKKVPEVYVVASDEGRDQCQQLGWTVEIALNHPLLKSGIELIDSPGRNENDALDDVVDTFFEKGTTPLVVYIIDGNELLRPSDRDTIRFIQDKYPQLSFMFVCNKVDTSARAKYFDARSSEEIDSEEEETTKELDKQRTVFSQLQNHGFIDDVDSYEICSCFYGISAQDVRDERRKKNGRGKATEAFARFQEGFLTILDETVKLQAAQVVSKLILLQMSLVQAMKRTRRTLLGTLFGSSMDYDTAKSIGNSLHDTLLSAVANKDKLGMLVNCNLINLEEKFVSATELYQNREIKSALTALELEAKTYYLLLVGNSGDKEQTTFSPQREDAPFLQFLADMKGVMLDRIFNVLKRVIEEFLKRIAEHVEIHSRRICNPLVEVAYEVAYGSVLLKTQNSVKQTNLNVLNVMKRTVSVALRRILKKLLLEGVLYVITEWRSPTDAQLTLEDHKSRKRIMEMIFSKLKQEAITESICTACTESLGVVYNAFLKVIDDLSHLNDLISTKTSKQMEEMATLYVPTVRHLVVQALALQFLLTKGTLALGPVLKATKHGQLHECTGWSDELARGACVVKVIKEKEVKPEVWAQTSVDLFNTMEIQATIGEPHHNLLHVHGWLIPETGVIHVLTEKADVDLTTALQQGRPLKTRIKIALDVINGINAIHKAHYIHQDVKADSILLMRDGTAKINMSKPEKPFERTWQGTPFHISLEMHKNYGKGLASDSSYDIYAFGIMLWVLCDGSGTHRPRVYERYSTIAAMKLAVEKEIYPERPVDATDACWELMTKCWRQRCVLSADDVLKEMEEISHFAQ